jgi:phospholipid/cholesterol/gamma-HCH transport system substrate-binding protein
LQLKVGAFILGGVALAIFVIFLLGSTKGFLQKNYRLHCFFDDVSGISIGSQVKLAGVNIGTVDNISFVPDPIAIMAPESEMTEEGPPINTGGSEIEDSGIKAKVELKLNPEYRDLITSRTVASIASQGLLGDKTVFLSIGKKAAIKARANGYDDEACLTPEGRQVDCNRPLADGERIMRTINPQDFAHMFNKMKHLSKKAEVALGGTQRVINNLNDVLLEVKTGNGLVHKIIYDPNGAKILDNTNRAVTHLDATASHFASIAGKIDQGRGTIGKFVNDPGVYNDLKTLLGKANRNKLVKSVIRYTLATRDKDQSK